jgi:hypothetical protein
MHIYGQDFGAVGGDAARGLQSFFDTFDEETFVSRSLTSEQACEMLVLPQLHNLLTERQRKQWRFPSKSVETIEQLIRDLKSGAVVA